MPFYWSEGKGKAGIFRRVPFFLSLACEGLMYAMSVETSLVLRSVQARKHAHKIKMSADLIACEASIPHSYLSS